jgi:hypothetical protein
VSECGQRANFNAFHQNLDLGTGAFAEGPVDGDAFAHPCNKFCRDHFEIVLAHDLQGAVIRRECIVEASRWEASETDGANAPGEARLSGSEEVNATSSSFNPKSTPR